MIVTKDPRPTSHLKLSLSLLMQIVGATHHFLGLVARGCHYCIVPSGCQRRIIDVNGLTSFLLVNLADFLILGLLVQHIVIVALGETALVQRAIAAAVGQLLGALGLLPVGCGLRDARVVLFIVHW